MWKLSRVIHCAVPLTILSGCGVSPGTDTRTGGRIRDGVVIDPGSGNSRAYKDAVVCTTLQNVAVSLLSAPSRSAGSVESLFDGDPVEVLSTEKGYRMVLATRSGAVGYLPEAIVCARPKDSEQIEFDSDDQNYNKEEPVDEDDVLPSTRPTARPPQSGTRDPVDDVFQPPRPIVTPKPIPPAPPKLNGGEDSIKLARNFLGFSYWWGGARLKVGETEKGTCSFVNGKNDYNGHTGPWGADCSGFVAKMWNLPEAMPLDSQKHPFGTIHFIQDGKWWNLIERSSAKIGDAGVYRTGGAGHIVLIESTTAWGDHMVVEAKGCRDGIVRNLKKLGTSYKFIRLKQGPQ